MDESGFSDYPDAWRDIVLVPADYPGDTILIPFGRNTKMATMVAAIAEEGTALKFLIIVSRKMIEV
jgi:hypothetical protein